MVPYDPEPDSFENFIRFYEAELRAIHRGEVNAVRDFTASFRRSLVGHGVVVSRYVAGRGLSWVLTPRAVGVLEAVWRVV